MATQPTISLPTGPGVDTPAVVSADVNAGLSGETTFIEGQTGFSSLPNLPALTPGVDDPSNAQGLGAPAIIRGTVYAHLAQGVTVGAGQVQATQAATLAGLQAALNKAGSLGKFFEIEPGTYEIYGSSGLVVPAATPIYWKGSKESVLSQFSANAPILVYGDATGATTLYHGKLDGVGLQYGVSQSGDTSAIAILMGPLAWCILENILVTPNGTFPVINPSYIAMSTISTGTWFNNTLRNIRLYGSQQTLLLQAATGSGNLFQDIYMSNGGNSNASESVYAALSGPAFSIANPGYGTMSGNVYERINIESVKCSGPVLLLQEAQSAEFIGLHFENLELTATGASLIGNVGSNVVIENMDTYDIQVPASLGETYVLTNSGAGEMNIINGLRMGWSYNSNPGLLSPMSIVNNGGNNDQNATTRLRGLVVTDATNGNNTTSLTLFDGNYQMTYSSATYSAAVGEMDADQVSFKTSSYQPVITGTAYTHYGCHEDAVLMVPASLAAACTITLSNKRIASGLGSSLATKTGNTVRIRRISGTYANTLTVKDSASGSTLTTNSAAATDLLYTFNGTNWVAAT